MNNHLYLDITADWDNIDSVRSKAEQFLKLNLFDSQDIFSIVMVCSELVENAIKYGDYKNPQNKISLSIELNDNSIIMEVKNPMGKYSNRFIKELDRTIQWIRGFQNPFEAYREKLKEVAQKEYVAGESGLGLTRIAYEGESILDFYLEDTNMINVTAVYQLYNGQFKGI